MNAVRLLLLFLIGIAKAVISSAESQYDDLVVVADLEAADTGRYLAAGSSTVLAGGIIMQVLNVTDFLGDNYAQYAVAQGIAEAANITVGYVHLSAEVFIDLLWGEGVQANYTITIPSTASVKPYAVRNKLDTVTLSQLNFDVQAHIQKVNGNNYTVNLTSKSFVSTVGDVTTTTSVPSYTFLSGKLWLLVPDAATFKLDHYAKYAVAQAIAEAAGVSVNYVQLSVTVLRRLSETDSIDFEEYGRRLVGTVEVDYIIIVPSSSSITAGDAKRKMESTTTSQMFLIVQQKVAAVTNNTYANVTSKSPLTSTYSATTLTTTPFLSLLTGSLNLTVPDTVAFLNDSYAQYAVAQGIAQVAGISVNDVNLTVELLNRRRLLGSFDPSVFDREKRRLSSAGVVEITYTITVQTTDSVTPLTVNNKLLAASLGDMTAAIQEHISKVKGPSFVVAVIGKSLHSVKPHQAPSIGAQTPQSQESNSQPCMYAQHVLRLLLVSAVRFGIA